MTTQVQPQRRTETEAVEVQGPMANIFLQPICGPSVLGLFGLGAATFMVGALWAGWFGSVSSFPFLAPFVGVLGTAQLLAAMWAFRARDALATAMHGTWGAFWLAFGVLYLFTGGGFLTQPTGIAFPELAFWLIPMAAITWSGAVAATQVNLPLVVIFGTLAAACSILAAALVVGNSTMITAGGWVLVASGVAAWYGATALMMEEVTDREVLPIFRTRVHAKVTPGIGEPGVMHGQ